ncbi:MAG: protein kinase [Parachlamydiales bacterium]|nr:protein kinase [Parachlamydiales bacterium]
MSNVTFHYLGKVSATAIAGSSGQAEERLEVSCFPNNHAAYHIRCRTPKGDLELAPLNPKPLPGRTTKCCCCTNVPRFVELTLMVDGKQKRMEVNLRSLAKRCHVTREKAYDACAENRLHELLEDVGLPIKWQVLLTPTRLPKEVTEPLIEFIRANFRHWKQQCAEGNLRSIFIPAKNPVKCDVEYFSDGDIYVCYIGMSNEKQIGLAADLSEKLANPEWREFFHQDHFTVYQYCSENLKGVRGILQIYRTSQYPNRFHIYQEQYKHTLDECVSLTPPSTQEPLHESKTNGRHSPGDKDPLRFLGKNSPPGSSPFLSRRATSRSLKNGHLGAKGKPLSIKAKVKMAQDLLTGLSALHEHHIVHLGLEPKAIYIHPETTRSEVEAAIGRFEQARIVHGNVQLTILATSMKAPFLAPELTQNPYYQNQILLPENPYPADVYSLGVIFRELFGLEEPLPKDSPQETIFLTIRRMLQLDPTMRMTAAQALKAFMDLKL